MFLKFGKEVADNILTGIAKISQSEARNEDTLARVGLAKLAFILPSANRIGAKRLAERVNEQVTALNIKFEKNNIPFNINIGIAAIDISTTTSVDDITQLADRHLEQALKQEGNCIIIDDSVENKDEPIVHEELAPLTAEPSMDSALTLANSHESVRLKPYLSILLSKLLPLLKVCNTQLKLGIDDAIAIIEKRLKK